jgi:hypothetical protein
LERAQISVRRPTEADYKAQALRSLAQAASKLDGLAFVSTYLARVGVAARGISN